MKIYIIGIGGIGTSALARYFLHQGYQVSGSDATQSEITNELKKEGAKVFIGHKASNIKFIPDKVVYSSAIAKNNPELNKSLNLKLPAQSYSQALGELTKRYFTIAVAGSHGKSTTTALLSLVLAKAGFDPTVIVGTKLREFGNSNFRAGKSHYLIIEADEYNRSFYNYHPQVAVVTNIDKEHLDTYKNLDGVKRGFRKFIENLHPQGVLVANWQDKNIRDVTKNFNRKTQFFNRKTFKHHSIKVPGFHNQLNAEAAWQVAKYLGIEKSLTEKVFTSYKGAWRRLETIKPKNSFWQRFKIISDYAHHPTEIKATLSGLRERYRQYNIICIFQPHQQDRLTRLFDDYPKSFLDANRLFLLPVYVVKGRDNYLKNQRNSFDLYQLIKDKFLDKNNYLQEVFYHKNLEILLNKLKSFSYSPKTVLVFMGAGSLDNWIKNKL